MKINGSGPGSTDKSRGIGGATASKAIEGAKNGRDVGRASGLESELSERVAISGRAKETAKAKELAMSAPDTDEARIAKLKAAISDGSYKVSADAIADKLVDEHLFNSL